MFYGYNPIYLITFFVVWFFSIEEQSQKLVQAYVATLGYPTGLTPDNLAISLAVDWP